MDLDLKVAWVDGDEVMDTVKSLMAKGEKFENTNWGGALKDWEHEPVAAQ